MGSTGTGQGSALARSRRQPRRTVVALRLCLGMLAPFTVAGPAAAATTVTSADALETGGPVDDLLTEPRPSSGQLLRADELVTTPAVGGDVAVGTGCLDDGRARFVVQNTGGTSLPAGSLTLAVEGSTATEAVPDLAPGATFPVWTGVPTTLQVRWSDGRVVTRDTGTEPCATHAWRPASLTHVAATTGLDRWHAAGSRGGGVDVALVDTGVGPLVDGSVPSLLHGPDLSFESQDPATRHRDGFGHGTHLAGILGGSRAPLPDDPILTASELAARPGVDGLAPGARLLSVRVGASNGMADVTQVIAAIDWIVQHRTSHGLNVRVLVLAYATTSSLPYVDDPLAHAVQNAWDHGIVVVAATGNRGVGAEVGMPARNPSVLAVGALDTLGSDDPADHRLASFSSSAGSRQPDLLAPGRSVLSLRAEGAAIAAGRTHAWAPGGLIRGSGTSQAAAVVAGAAALVVGEHPSATPDQVKDLLVRTARGVPDTTIPALDMGAALGAPLRWVAPSPVWTRGRGSIEAARGDSHVADAGGRLTGEQDIFGGTWKAEPWAEASEKLRSWSGGSWNGQQWTGTEWWSSNSWSSNSWSSNSWSSNSWSSNSWSSNSWSSNSWSSM